MEECLKIRNILGEFEEYNMSGQSPYAQLGHKEFARSLIAIVGTREHIISENIGVLGDITAGKEQTFGTMTARAHRRTDSQLFRETVNLTKPRGHCSLGSHHLSHHYSTKVPPRLSAGVSVARLKLPSNLPSCDIWYSVKTQAISVFAGGSYISKAI